MPRISEVSGEFLRRTIDGRKDLFSVVDALLEEGKQIVGELSRDEGYDSLDDFLAAGDRGETSLVALEGRSVRKGNRFVLQDCPMGPVLDAAKVDGKLPESFPKFVEEYKSVNPDNAAIFHPGCVIHQFVRQQLISNLRVDGTRSLNYFQLGCGSKASGKVAYDNYGMRLCQMAPADVDALLEKGPAIKACVYAVVDKSGRRGDR